VDMLSDRGSTPLVSTKTRSIRTRWVRILHFIQPDLTTELPQSLPCSINAEAIAIAAQRNLHRGKLDAQRHPLVRQCDKTFD